MKNNQNVIKTLKFLTFLINCIYYKINFFTSLFQLNPLNQSV